MAPYPCQTSPTRQGLGDPACLLLLGFRRHETGEFSSFNLIFHAKVIATRLHSIDFVKEESLAVCILNESDCNDARGAGVRSRSENNHILDGQKKHLSEEMRYSLMPLVSPLI
ncbi:hypothetical protein Pla8534_19820 [Lignipirellula cremea]|uniref:Uncharacterized protein n=1 Tax=Lignipirellula cremea TaxID=2528010 RepID=A0A518DQU7_9BACT|nr:hypothetical protein Pla8534_19820 [Lignipirellula cremea]